MGKFGHLKGLFMSLFWGFWPNNTVFISRWTLHSCHGDISADMEAEFSFQDFRSISITEQTQGSDKDGDVVWGSWYWTMGLDCCQAVSGGRNRPKYWISSLLLSQVCYILKITWLLLLAFLYLVNVCGIDYDKWIQSQGRHSICFGQLFGNLHHKK